MKNLFNFLKFTVLLYLCLLAGSAVFAQDGAGEPSGQTRDPFVPLISSDGRLLTVNKDTQEELQVSGIIYDKQGASYAIVNSTVVRSGDTVGSFKVLKIEKDKVSFEKDGQPLEIEIYKEETE